MNNKKIYYILSTLGALLCLISFILYAAPFIEFRLASVSINSISGFSLLVEEEEQDFGNIGILISFLFTIIIMLCSIASPILTYLKDTKKINFSLKKSKEKENVGLILVLGGVAIIGLFIFEMYLVQLSNYRDYSYAKLGGGAIASSILKYLGLCCSGVAYRIFLEKEKKQEITNENIPKNETEQ